LRGKQGRLGREKAGWHILVGYMHETCPLSEDLGERGQRMLVRVNRRDTRFVVQEGNLWHPVCGPEEIHQLLVLRWRRLLRLEQVAWHGGVVLVIASLAKRGALNGQGEAVGGNRMKVPASAQRHPRTGNVEPHRPAWIRRYVFHQPLVLEIMAGHQPCL